MAIICPLFVLPSCWAMYTQVSKVIGFSPFEMVYHIEPQICSIYKLGKIGINVRADQYMDIMFKRKAMMDQIIIDKKTYDQKKILKLRKEYQKSNIVNV